VTAVAPSGGIAGGGTQLTITGSDFATAATVTVGGEPCSNPAVISANLLTCTLPPAAAGTIAQVDVTVTNPGTAAATLSQGFFYLGAPVLWLKADTGVTQAGGAISAWADQSGLQNNASQANAGNMPTLVASSPAFNNLPAVQFGGNRSMNLANRGVLNNVAGAASALAFSVVNPGAGGALLSYTTQNSAGGNRYFHRMNSGCTQVGSATGNIGVGGRTLDSDATCQDVSGGKLTANVAYVSTGTIDYLNRTGFLDVNGQVLSSTANFQDGTNTSATNSGSATIGTYNGQNFNGSIGEILMFNVAITDAQRAILDAYLAARFNIH
jgi:hypothetical protein